MLNLTKIHYPCYAGPIPSKGIKGTSYFENSGNIMYYYHSNNFDYIYDYKLSETDNMPYDLRLSAARHVANILRNSGNLLDLPMEIVNNVGELVALEKRCLTEGADGVIINNVLARYGENEPDFFEIKFSK